MTDNKMVIFTDKTRVNQDGPDRWGKGGIEKYQE